MTQEEKFERAQEIARNILLLGDSNFVGLSHDELLMVADNIIADFPKPSMHITPQNWLYFVWGTLEHV